MKCFLIFYKPRNTYETIKVNHALFGRILQVKYKGSLARYYYGGLLEKVPFAKLANASYIIPYDDIMKSSLDAIGGVRYYIIDIEHEQVSWQTGKDKWIKWVAKKGYNVKGITR